ncbi:hypothetical protein E4T56_gene11725 [Termitomyces sp. T112]|nr:hypothetical protein E4T56_gene11725 [Termitomyces sp. T112]
MQSEIVELESLIQKVCKAIYAEAVANLKYNIAVLFKRLNAQQALSRPFCRPSPSCFMGNGKSKIFNMTFWKLLL